MKRIHDLTDLDLFIKCTPFPQQRHRFSREFGTVYDPSAKDKRKIRDQVIMILRDKSLVEYPIFEIPIKIILEFTFTKPKSYSKRTYVCVKPDLDNLIKGVLDSCNSILYRDDALICSIVADKVYGETEGVKVRIEAMPHS